jgi:polysaccharide export outer membrane protein
LIEDMPAMGKTPTMLARDMEKALGTFIRDPVVTVVVTSFVGSQSEQIRVVGEASKPQALPYRQNMTLLDVMIAVGGLTDFADGNGATLLRASDDSKQQYSVRLNGSDPPWRYFGQRGCETWRCADHSAELVLTDA